jgi:hypothetical protein
MASKSTQQRPRRVLRNVARLFQEALADAAATHPYPRSAMIAHLVCMRAARWRSADYAALMTVSGFGLSFAYEHGPKHWVARVPPPEAEQRIERAFGFGWEWRPCAEPDQAWRLLKRSLDAGKCLRAPYDEEILLAGAADARKRADRQVFVLCQAFDPPGQWWTWPQFQALFHSHSELPCGRHTRRLAKAPPRAVAVEVITNIVRWARRHPLADNPDYGQVEFGLAGIEAFAADIEDLEKPAAWFARGWRGGAAVYPQWTARHCTAGYLKAAADQFAPKPAARLRAAARHYAAAYKAWQRWERQLGRPPKAPEDAWDCPRRRRLGAQAVRKAAEREKAAVIELAAALAALGAAK